MELGVSEIFYNYYFIPYLMPEASNVYRTKNRTKL